MMDKKNVLDLDFDHAHELWHSLKKNGWTNCDLKAVSEGDFLGKVLNYMKENYVNLNKEPKVPHGEQIIHNNNGGLWKFNFNQIYILIKKDFCQQNIYENGFNANLLDYMLEYPHKIPEEWKLLGKIYFPGTTYSTKHDFEQIRFMHWGVKWGTKTEPEWWSDSEVLSNILKSKDKIFFAMKNAI